MNKDSVVSARSKATDNGLAQKPHTGFRMPYRWYMVMVLATILAFNFMDRWAIGLLLQDIKRDPQLTDLQLGALTGIAFSIFYALLGIPIARLGDRSNRVVLISLTTALWCGAVALCGLANSFWTLLAIRAAVAIGEAGCLPLANSLIGDYFDRDERSRAVSRYMLGGPLSVLLGFLVAGWLNEHLGWRLTFALLGLPGLFLAALALCTLREPRNDEPPSALGNGSANASINADKTLIQTWEELWRNATYRRLLILFSISTFFSHGLAQWKPAFFVRSFGLGTAELGVYMTLIYGAGAVFGILIGGEWATRYAPRNEKLQLRAMAGIYVVMALLSALTFVATNQYIALTMLGLTALLGGTVGGPFLALLQSLVPSSSRAMAIALLYLFANLIGMGLGPLAVGGLSDFLAGALRNESLRYALLAMTPGYLVVALMFQRASHTVTADISASSPG